MIRRSWRTQLKASTSQEAVLTVVSRYLDEWRPEEISALPHGAWPASLRTRADVLAHALKLNTMHASFDGDPRGLAGLQELLLFFTHASVRCNQLAPAGVPPHPAEKPGQRRPVRGDEY
ncbi:MAG TPA: hypothetical protein VF038_02400 [Usitatibacter sp.]